MIAVQTKTAKIKAKKTAAEATSLAKPDNSLNSKPIRSIVNSIEVLTSSKTSTRQTTPINKINSISDSEK